MNERRRVLIATSSIVFIFLVVQIGALALVEPFKQSGHQFVSDTSDPTISILYVGAILVATVAMLAAFKYEVDELVRGVIVFAGAYIAWFVFRVLFPSVSVGPLGQVNVLAVSAAAALGLALYFYPEWYVIDAAGIVMGIGAAAIFGINFGILPALVLLAVLAVYDAISVYGTEHMLTLASGAMNLRAPILLIVPLTLPYSFLDGDIPDPAAEESQQADTDSVSDSHDTENQPEGASGDTLAEESETRGGDEDGGTGQESLDRDALFIGLGDAVIPTVLVASAGFFVTDVPVLSSLGLRIPLPALTAIFGTLLGLIVLLWLVLKGRAHAGLPLLNGGAIGGYLIGALASGIPLLEALGIAGVL